MSIDQVPTSPSKLLYRDLLMCALDQFHYGSSFVGVSKGTAWGGVSRQYVVIVLRRVQHMQLY